MDVTAINTFDHLHDLRVPWNELSDAVPFRSHDWLCGWWRHYGQRRRLLVLTVRDASGQLVGVAPWYLETSATKGRVIRALGSGEVCSDYLTVLCAVGREDEVACALAEFLASDACDGWELLELTGVDSADAVIQHLARRLESHDQVVSCHASYRCWRIALPDSWEEFLAMQSKSHRKQLRRCESRSLAGCGMKIHRPECPTELETAWEVLVDLHQRRRISLGEPGCFASEHFRAFHREMVGRLLDSGALRLAWLELNGRPAAVEYQFAGAGVTYAYQAGFDPDRLDEEPGRIIMIGTIRQAIAEGQYSFDFLRGDEPYKAHWRAEPRQMWDYRIANRRALARLRHRAWLAVNSTKAWVKGGLARVK